MQKNWGIPQQTSNCHSLYKKILFWQKAIACTYWKRREVSSSFDFFYGFRLLCVQSAHWICIKKFIDFFSSFNVFIKYPVCKALLLFNIEVSCGTFFFKEILEVCSFLFIMSMCTCFVDLKLIFFYWRYCHLVVFHLL